MKKIFVISLLALFIVNTESSAQTDNKWRGSITLDNIPLTEGSNTVNLTKEGQGTLQFTKAGNSFTNVRYLDSAGKVHMLTAVRPGTQGAPKPECKYPLPDACFATADKNIGLCICKSTDLSSGEQKYNFAFCRACNMNGSGIYKSN